jgi:hypothetical protein
MHLDSKTYDTLKGYIYMSGIQDDIDLYADEEGTKFAFANDGYQGFSIEEGAKRLFQITGFPIKNPGLDREHMEIVTQFLKDYSGEVINECVTDRQLAQRLYEMAWDKSISEPSLNVVESWIKPLDGNFKEMLRQIWFRYVGNK